MEIKLRYLFITLVLFAGINQTAAQGTVFTYQGRLNDSGQPANGTNYGMVFYLYDAPTNGNLLGSLGIASVTVSNGLFTLPLDFDNEFDGTPRWLQISVQKNGGAFTQLIPRQQITPSPYAIFANTASNLSGTLPVAQLNGSLPVGQLSGIVPLTQLPGAVVTNSATGVTLNGTFSGDGSGLLNTVTAGNYVFAFSSASQVVSSANTFQAIPFDALNLSGWTYFGGISDTFTCQQSGMYLIQYDAEVETTTSGATTISLRAFNNTTVFEIPGSQSSVTLSVANQPAAISKSFLTFCSVGELLQFQFTGSSTAAELIVGNGVGTAKPSISCTIIRIQ